MITSTRRPQLQADTGLTLHINITDNRLADICILIHSHSDTSGPQFAVKLSPNDIMVGTKLASGWLTSSGLWEESEEVSRLLGWW